MDWLLHNQHNQTFFSSLGTLVGDTYTASDNCLDVLKEIYQKLLTEDKVSRSFRRAIHFSHGVQNDILPLLISTKDKEIISSIFRILACLLVPVECLLPLEIMSQTEVGRIVVFELKAFLAKSKTLFRDPRSTKAITDFIKSHIVLEERGQMIGSECEAINNCLLVLRNILHIPESGRAHKNLQNVIVWNLFLQNIDQILLHLMTNKHKAYWSVAIVQLIAVLYKDQHVGTLQKLLHVWFEGSLSESSEDNESNTTPDYRRSLSPVLTSSELNSDSSEGGSKVTKNQIESHVSPRTPTENLVDEGAVAVKMLVLEDSAIERKPSPNASRRTSRDSLSVDENSTTSSGHCSGSASKPSGPQHQHHRSSQRNKQDLTKKSDCSQQQEFSDFGYGSHVETPGAVSTSSNEEESPPIKRPFHQKPHIQKTRYCNKQLTTQGKKEIRRKKLMKRSNNTLINLKALVNHLPRDEDITHVLKEFTVGFLLTGFEPLVSALHTELVTPTSGLPIDTSHFFWLLTYFLKFAGQLELDIEQIRRVLCFDVLSYLVYEGVSVSEYIEQTVHVDADVRASLRRQHLIVTAIREFVLSLEALDRVSYLSPQEKEDLRELRSVIGLSTDLKCLFVLMLRSYRPDVQSRQYLEDLVITNHVLLSFLEHNNENSTKHGHKTQNMRDHLKQFASVDVMKNYGLLLEDFKTNGEYVNDCVFTMMHHIGGEINHLASLCQPNILKTFTQIWESDFKLCEDWSDLIEYVIHSFVNLPRKCPFVGTTSGFPLATPLEDNGWSKEDCENLYWYFALSCAGPDLIENIIRLFNENGVTKTRIAVIERLLKQGVITSDQYKQFLSETSKPSTNHSNNAVSSEPLIVDEIAALIGSLVKNGLSAHVLELQRLLLDTRHAKLLLQKNSDERSQHHYEPVPYYYSMLNQSIPVVCWSCEQTSTLRNKSYQLLLRQLGFHSPTETGKLFFRIPSFWSPDVLLSVAKKLGSVNPADLLIESQPVEKPMFEDAFKQGENLQTVPIHHFQVSRATMVNYTPTLNVSTSWLDIVQKSKIAANPDQKDFLGDEMMDQISVVTKAISEVEDLECASVVSITDTNASDLTRMCISDEDEDGNPLPTW